MNTEVVLTAGIIAVMVLIIGMALLFLYHLLVRIREKEIMRFIGRDLIGKVRKAAADLMNEGMDIIPEKLMEAKRTVEKEADMR